MPIYATKSENIDREKATPGNVQAVCTAVRDIGMQQDKSGKISHKIIIVWEILQTIKTGKFAGKRMVQSSHYNASMYDTAYLRKDIESWRGRPFASEEEALRFDLEKLIGKNCLLNLVKSDDGRYVNIKGITPLVAGLQPITPELAPDHVYEWIDKLAAKAVQPSTETEHSQVPHSKTPIRNATAADLVDSDTGPAFTDDDAAALPEATPAADEIPF